MTNDDLRDSPAPGPIVDKTRPADIAKLTEELIIVSRRKPAEEACTRVETLGSGNDGDCHVVRAAFLRQALRRQAHTKAKELIARRSLLRRIIPRTLRAGGGGGPHRYVIDRAARRGRGRAAAAAGPGRHLLWRRPPFLLHVFVGLAGRRTSRFLHRGMRARGDGGTYTEDEGHVPVIHGDLKPENVFLRWTDNDNDDDNDNNKDPMPEVVLGDFRRRQGGPPTGTRGSTAARCCYTTRPRKDVAVHGNAPAGPARTAVALYYLRMVNNARTTASDVRLRPGPGDVRDSRQGDVPAGDRPPTSRSCLGMAAPPRWVCGRRSCGVWRWIRSSALVTMSFDEDLGLLPVIDGFRIARDELVQRRRMPMISPLEWARPRGTW
ncbi:hypothetical protein F4778DRAFT_784701 [Xylariomycetidae sp. FL2044]|nr:hypothetical protein F4778DRAFT_784701 [Xylariomycetidae sp. FL2044]